LTATDFLSPDNRERALDACGFMPGVASRIAGIGGKDTPGDQAYAFHTEYVPCGRGTAVFTLRPVNLAATKGNLTVRLNAISTAPGAIARTVKMAMIPLQELAATGGMQLAVKTKNGVLYSAIGLIYGPTDAAADDLLISLETSPSEDDSYEDEATVSYTSFGQNIARPMSQLAARGPATLAGPVSQVCTRRQFAEPAYAAAAASLGLGGQADARQWRLAYVRRVLESYGMAQAGARGLGFMVEPDALPARLAEDGCGIVAMGYAGENKAPGMKRLSTLDDLRYANIGSVTRFEEAVELRSVEDWSVSDDLRDFDFCWSVDAVDMLATRRDAVQFIKNSFQSLKVGGLAVHVVPFTASDTVSADGEGGPLFSRSDVERLAFDVISFGHEIAQIKFGTAEEPAMGFIGLILRKGESTFF
jgi:hypothetical protein